MLHIEGTIGILGGGQLGRMMAVSATQLGYRCIGYAPQGDNVAADVCAEFFENDWSDQAALEAFAAKCDVITWEFENVPLAAIDALPSAHLHPPRKALETAQDRLNEKRFVGGLGGRTAPFCAIESRADLDSAIEQIGMPGILKTRRDGYDGKGQWRLADARDVEALNLPDVPTVYEGFVEFAAEFAVILARGQDGQIRFWDSTRNEHEDGILARTILPPSNLIETQIDEARQLAQQVADALEYVGVLTLEFFATEDGPVFNEMAPRVHNSGHWTIEGAVTSQFANHIRAVAGVPLGDTSSVADEVEMRNIIGKPAENALALLNDPRARLHLYGKATASDGRKMGHVTYVGGAGADAPVSELVASADLTIEEPITQELFLIYARAANGVIGRDGTLPWHLPADLKRFKALTLGKPMIMGRKTFESLPGLLPGRRHIVLTRRDKWSQDGAEIAHSAKEALALAGNGEVAIIGGAAIFDVFVRLAARAEVTQIHEDYEGDVLMPELGPRWELTTREDFDAEGTRPAYSFLTYRQELEAE